MRILLQELSYLVTKDGIPLKKREQFQVVGHVPRIAHHDDAAERLSRRDPVVITREGAQRAVWDVDVQGDDPELHIGEF